MMSRRAGSDDISRKKTERFEAMFRDERWESVCAGGNRGDGISMVRT